VQNVVWAPISGFPAYLVSNFGQILNQETDRLLRISYTNHGHAKCSLVGLEGRQTLSVAYLVAMAHLERTDPLATHVVVLNGNQADLRAENLVWRTASFAWKYTRQQRTTHPIYVYNLAVVDISTGRRFNTILEAAESLGLLYGDIWRSTYTGREVYPTGSIFKVVE
jgi:hypothetical protein